MEQDAGAANQKPVDYASLSEEQILADIRHFQDRLDNLAAVQNTYDQARRQVYSILLQHRKQLLAAYRAGHPEQWPEFGPENVPV